MSAQAPPPPLHVQLAGLVKADIESGRLRSGDRLPTEKQLMQQHGISSTTVRQALGSLVQQGLIYRRAGKGTFVADPIIVRDLIAFSGFSEDMLSKGHRPGAIVLRAGLSRAPAWARAGLNLVAGDHAYEVARLRSADDVVIALEEVWFARPIGSQLALLDVDLAVSSLTSVLEDQLGLSLSRALQTIRATAATASVAELLDVSRKAPMLEIERTAYTRDGQTCYVSKGIYRADRYDYRGWIDRKPDRDARVTGRTLVGTLAPPERLR